MDTIRSYVEQIFASLPMTAELEQLKREILENMEDKYNELKNDGKNENEAVGTVISEFGNIDELLEELDMEKSKKYDREKDARAAGHPIKSRQLTEDEVYDYLLISKVTRRMIAMGTFLCILGVAFLILAGGYISEKGNNTAGFASILGVIILLVFVSAAITLFILAGSKNDKYRFIEKENIELSAAIKTQIENIFESRKDSFVVKNCVGVVLCIFSVIQLLAASVFLQREALLITISVSFMLFIIAVAVYLFIIGNSEKGAYERILQKGEFSLKNKNSYLKTVSSIYWCFITAVYLGWSFTTGKWGTTWIIWPITGVLWGAIEALFQRILGKE